MLTALRMHSELQSPSLSLRETEDWLALGAGCALLLVGTSRRSAVGAGLALSAVPLLYRGVTGRWPGVDQADGSTRRALGGSRGVHVREGVRLEHPVEDVYRFWRQLDHLPSFMKHLERVTENGNGRSHWVARGPGGLLVQWDAEVIEDLPNKRLSWRSLPGADVVTAGSVTFEPVRGGESAQVNVHLQYAPPAGKPGVWLASLFGRDAGHTIREDLRRFKQVLEAGESPRVAPGGQEA